MEITVGSKYPKAENGLTLPLRTSLGSSDLSKHRAMVAFELEVLAKKFDRYGWDRERGTAAQDRLIRDWVQALQDYPIEEISAACREAVLSRPSAMPNEGHILAKIMAARAMSLRLAPRRVEPEPEREKVSAETAAEILAKAGFRPRRMVEGAEK